MAAPPQASIWQQWVDGTKELLGLAQAKQPPKLPPRAAEVAATRKKAEWETATLKPAQAQIDAMLAAASQPLVDNARKLAGNEGAGLVGNKFAQLRQQFHDEASKLPPEAEPMAKLVASLSVQIEAVRGSMHNLLASGGFSQHVQELGAPWHKDLKPAQEQIDAMLAAASKAMMDKAQKKAGSADVGFVADKFTELKRQFSDEVAKIFPQNNALKRVVADFPARLKVLNQSLDAMLANDSQFRQELTKRAAENDQWGRELRRDWAKKVTEPLEEMLPRPNMTDTESARLKSQTEWQKANQKTFNEHRDRFEAALKAGKLKEAQQIFDDVAGAKMPEALSQFKHEKDQAAYLAQMKKEASAEFNPDNKFDPKKMEQWERIAEDLRDKTDSGLSEAEVLAIRIYTARNYKYINPAVANQKDRKDRPTDWMDSSMKPDPSKAAQILAKEHEDKRLPPPTPAEIEARRNELIAQLKEYGEGGKKQLYEEGALHAGMMMEAFKKMKKKGKMEEVKLYRGARMTPAIFAREYQVGELLECEAFMSSAVMERVAREFASGGDGAQPDQTVSVLVVAHMSEAVSVDALSINRGESEYMVMPGTKLKVEKIEEDPIGMDDLYRNKHQGKAPEATASHRVTLKQVIESEQAKPS